MTIRINQGTLREGPEAVTNFFRGDFEQVRCGAPVAIKQRAGSEHDCVVGAAADDVLEPFSGENS